MSVPVLPREINYTARPAPLPVGTTCTSVVTPSTNGAVFSDGAIVQFDLVSRGYLQPSSLYIRYKMNTTSAIGAIIKAVPCYTIMSRLETIIGSSTVESISNYGQLCNMLINCKMNNSTKAGLASSFAIGTNTQAFTNDNVNSRTLILNETTSVACPLGCMLSNCETLYPLKYSPAVRIQITLDTIANIFAGAIIPTAFNISNVELCYDVIDFGAEVDASVLAMADASGKIMIKSQSYASSGQNITAGSVGSLEYVFNYRLASIKSLFSIFGATHATAVNKSFDSLDVTSGNGAYGFFVAGAPYPNRMLSTLNAKASILMELSQAFGPAHDILSSQFAITPTGFNAINTSTTTATAPGTFYLGVNTERLSSNGVLLSGVSSQSSPISLRIDINSATTNQQVLNVVALYDAIIEVDMVNKQVTIMQ
jgi:hypothetical protein